MPCRIVPALALLLFAPALAACGAAAPRGGSVPAKRASPAATALSRELSRLDRLVVERRDAFPQNHVRFGFPARVVAEDPVQVRAVARALLALPHLPRAPLAVPIDLGITYRLTFATPGGPLPAITVAATGGEAVRGLGPTRWLARSPGFWTTLGTAMRLRHPGYRAFRGRLPGA